MSQSVGTQVTSGLEVGKVYSDRLCSRASSLDFVSIENVNFS